MTADPFEFDDAAYVLGALSDDDRAAFETHLPTCAACSARVGELRDVPAQLAAVPIGEFDDLGSDRMAVDADDHAEPLPDTLLPGLLRRASRRRRRQHAVVVGLAAAVAACLIALVAVSWPASPSPAHPQATSRSFTALTPVPVQMTATLTDKVWGTAIDVHCVYRPGAGLPPGPRPTGATARYELVVYGRNGDKESLGGWSESADDVKYTTGTYLRPTQISRIEITLANGTPILRLKT